MEIYRLSILCKSIDTLILNENYIEYTLTELFAKFKFVSVMVKRDCDADIAAAYFLRRIIKKHNIQNAAVSLVIDRETETFAAEPHKYFELYTGVIASSMTNSKYRYSRDIFMADISDMLILDSSYTDSPIFKFAGETNKKIITIK